MNKWLTPERFPGSDASPAAKRSFYSDMLAQSNQWLKDAPNSQMPWVYRLQAIENLDDIPAAEVEANVEQALQFLVRDDGPEGPGSGGYAHLAAILYQKHVAPEREVELARKALAKWEIESKEPPDDLDTTEEQERHTANRAYDRAEWLGYEIDGYLQLKQKERAEVQLDQMNRWLQDYESLPGNADSSKAAAPLYTLYWGLRAREAELQGHREDAMGFYENSLLARLSSQQKPEASGKDDLADNAHKLWNSLGGTEEGWQLWYARPANDAANQSAEGWQDADQHLPAFKLTDLNGKTWDLAALRGKTVLINFWASWCGPCRLELPRLQKLAGQYKDRPDVEFLTLNLDADPGLAQSVVKELALSLVAIPAYSYALGELSVGALPPATWILDRNGVVRLKTLGYDPGEKWESGVESAIAKVSALAFQTSPGTPATVQRRSHLTQ